MTSFYYTGASVQPELLSHLPAVFQGIEHEDRLLKDFLAAFDDILFGQKGMHAIISSLASYLDARTAPPEFLPWLAGWMGATLYHELPEPKQSQFVANAADYYRYRGTPENLKKLLELFTDGVVEILEPVFPVFQIGLQSTIGSETYIGGGPPHAFRVSLGIPASDGDDSTNTESRKRHTMRIAREVIDLEKPAHTTYELRIMSISGVAQTPPPELTTTSSVAKRATRSRKRKEGQDGQGI